MKISIKIVILILFWLWANTAYSQSDFILHINTDLPGFSFEKREIVIQSTHTDTVSIQLHIQTVVRQLQKQAFLEASLDSLIIKDEKVFAQLHIGPAYEVIRIQNGNIPSEVLKAIGLKPLVFGKEKWTWLRVEVLQEQLLGYAENNGYPFAEVWLDRLVIDVQQICAYLNWDLHDKVTIGDLQIIGGAKMKSTYLASLLGLQKGTNYSKAKILEISKQLKSLPFLIERQVAKVTFRDKKATIHLFLEHKNASRFDLLVGILPDNRSALQGRQVTVTGNGVIDLFSAFGRGERLTIELDQIRPQTQQLNTYFNIPYLLHTPFGITIDFELFKNDSTNLLLQSEFGVQYFLEGEHYIQAFFENHSTRLLSINEALIIQQKILPQNLDTRQNLFGVEYYISRFNNRFNPRSGWASRVRASVGQKTIVSNNSIISLFDSKNPDFDFESLYDKYQNATIQYQLEGNFKYFIPINRRSTIYIQSKNGVVLNEETIFENELFRIGGNQIQRGFDEASILASLFSVNTIEYRWLFANNSNVYVFSDLGYIEKKMINAELEIQQLWGLGLGLQLETTIGIFGMSLALGKNQRNSNDFFDLRNPKIHFGYVSIF